ncbi:MAG: 16S rRNA (guanine(966)-N(2))-methyltransferase RsmD [Clostridiales Family XIII bacterium]|nr:16S rRNA (guanine(966)-N(2))-methyltransferase RsmD [Clostridiales Family XIII bacterium]
MRVIAGDAKGKKLFSPDDYGIRPTSDKVKGAIFNMIGARVADAVALDLFAGSGALGIEALSRGARRCYFCDHSAKARALIAKNLAHCGMTERATVLRCDDKAAFGMLESAPDIVFLDPPYGLDCHESCLAAASAAMSAAKGGIVVAEHRAALSLPDEIFGFVKIKEKKYGGTGVSVFAYGYHSAI